MRSYPLPELIDHEARITGRPEKAFRSRALMLKRERLLTHGVGVEAQMGPRDAVNLLLAILYPGKATDAGEVVQKMRAATGRPVRRTTPFTPFYAVVDMKFGEAIDTLFAHLIQFKRAPLARLEIEESRGEICIRVYPGNPRDSMEYALEYYVAGEGSQDAENPETSIDAGVTAFVGGEALDALAALFRDAA